MKKRLLIICSIIGVFLAGFKFPIYAETTPPDYSSSTSIMSSTSLDQYFYDNYELLPYIESSGSQYINTGIKGSSDLLINTRLSILNSEGIHWIFGSRTSLGDNQLGLMIDVNEDIYKFKFYNSDYSFSYPLNDYKVLNIKSDKNNLFVNYSLIHSFNEVEFNNNLDIYLFSLNDGGSFSSACSSARLYSFSIYDYAANEGEGALVRDYYPARAKSSGVIGLYDAVNKTFVTTSGSVPFDSPTGDPVNLSLGANVTQFLSGSLSWIGAIFEGINEMPIIWVFIAIGLAGVAFRWARRIVHF